LHILETKPNTPIATQGPTTYLDIAGEVQHACEMVEVVASEYEEVEHEKGHHVPKDLGILNNDVLDGLDTLHDACVPLYESAHCTKLVAVLIMMNMCIVHNYSNKFVNELFSLLRNFLLPIDNILSTNMYSVKTLTQHIGIKYKQIYACNVGCVLYKGPYANSTHCPKCGRARLKQVGHTQVLDKILCHFPIIPRLKWMYQSLSMVELLQWHEKNKSTNGLVLHVVNSKTWTHIEEAWLDFASDPQNLRLALSTNGFNPFLEKLCQWSTWPIYIFIYNLPLWLTTKRFFMMVAVLISG